MPSDDVVLNFKAEGRGIQLINPCIHLTPGNWFRQWVIGVQVHEKPSEGNYGKVTCNVVSRDHRFHEFPIGHFYVTPAIKLMGKKILIQQKEIVLLWVDGPPTLQPLHWTAGCEQDIVGAVKKYMGL